MSFLLLDLVVGIFLIIYYILESWVLFFIPKSLRMKEIAGQVALVTGGGSGMGRLLCLELAKKGCRIVTWDIDEEGNNETVRLLRAYHESSSVNKKHGLERAINVDSMVYGFKVDLCKRDDVFRVAQLVQKEVGTVDILINNAGVVSGKSFLSTSDQQNILTMNVNAICHFW
ncbi:unnamed protein product, partial [Notodromas monacha]